jgi:putative FmdB family regulatory protein
MAIYDHECQNPECKHEWEDTYSIKADPPKVCPKCNQETAKRVISLNGKGVVELTGNDLVEKIKSDGKQLAKNAYNSEKLYSNLLGESDYNKIQTRLDNQNRYRRR